MTLTILLALGLLVTPAQEPAPPPSPAVVSPASQELEAVALLCEQIATTVAQENLDELTTLLDLDLFLTSAFEGLDMNSEFLAGLRESLEAGQQPWNDIIATNRSSNGALHFLHTSSELPPRGLFRHTSDAGLNYYEFEFTRDAEGRLRVVDFKSFLQATWTQQSLRDLALPVLEQLKKGAADPLAGRDAALVRAAPQIKRIKEQMQVDGAAALKLFDDLPRDIRFEQPLLVLRLQIAAAVSDKEYLATIKEFKKHHPDSPSLPLVVIDWYLAREDWDAALSAVERVDAIIGGDPYLGILRAHALRGAKRFDAAVESVERAIEQDSRIEWGALWVLVEIALARGDNAAVYESLVRIDERYELEWGDLSQNAAYAEFAASPQYQQWLQYLESKSKR